MAKYNNWYNPSLEKLRNQTEKLAYQKRMQLIEEKKQRESIRTPFDIFLNKKARERLGGDNWFETTFRAIGQFFDTNYVEWFRKPLNALMNNLSAIGDTLDYAANLIKAPMIAAAKGEDVGERLKDAYGLGDRGRVAQNMSELREVLGAEDPSAEIGVSAGFGAITGAEIGTKIAPGVGTLIGGLIGAGIGTINSSIDVAVRESGTDNAFWKGTQTIGNTVTDMMMEYGVDPANFAGAIGDAFKGSNVKNITDAVASQSLDDMAKQTLDTTESFTKSLNGQQAYKVKDIMDHMYKSTAETVTKPRLDKAGKEIKVTAEQQRKQFNKKISDVLKAYMDNDKKSFNKNIIETGIGKYLSDDVDILNKQLDGMFSTLRHDANMSKIGRIAAFIDRFDAGFAKKLYKGTVPGLTLTSAKKAFVKMHNEWEQGILKTAQMYDKDIIKQNVDLNIVERAARQHYFNKFKKAGIQYEIPEGATPHKMNNIYRSMTNAMAVYYTNGNRREYQVLKGLRKGITLSNGVKSVNLGKAESNFKKIIRFINGDATVAKTDYDNAISELTDLFYFKNGLDYFQSLLFDPTYFRGDFAQVEKIAEAIVSKAIATVEDDPIRRYAKTIDSIIDKTVNFDNFRIDAENFYNNELHNAIQTILDSLKNKQEAINKDVVYKDLEDVLVRGHADAEAISRLAKLLKEDITDFRGSPIYDSMLNIYSKELGLDLNDTDTISYLTSNLRDRFVNDNFKGFEDALTKYSERNKLINEGARLRNSFMAYRNAIDNTRETIKLNAIDTTLRKQDSTKLSKLQSDRIVDIFKGAYRKELESRGVNPDEVIAIASKAAEGFALILNDLNSSDLTTYDIMLQFNNILSAGSARLNNFIKYSQIKDSKEYLNKFIDDISKSRKIANDKNIASHSRRISNNLNKLNGILEKSNLAVVNSMLSPLATNDVHMKLINNAITDYLFTGKDIPDNVKNILDSLNTTIVYSNGIRAESNFYNEIISSLDAIQNSVDMNEIQYLYNKLSSSFNYKFNRGKDIISSVQNVINTLSFATDKQYSNLMNGTFADNLMQQTIYDTVVKEIDKTIVDNLDEVIDNKTAKNVFKEVFKELNVNAETRQTIDDSLNMLFSKRNELITRLSELEDEKIGKPKEVPAKYTKLKDSLIAYKDELRNIKNSYNYTMEQYNYLKDSVASIKTRADARKFIIQAKNKVKDIDPNNPMSVIYNDVVNIVNKSYTEGSNPSNLKNLVQARIDLITNNYESKSMPLQTRIDEINQTLKNANITTTEDISKTQLGLVSNFKRETDALYNKLNVITTSLFNTNMDSSSFTLKNGKEFSNLVNNLDILKKSGVTTEQLETMKKILINKMNIKLLESNNYIKASEFINNVLKAEDITDSIRIENGNIFLGLNPKKFITQTQLKGFFNNIGGIYKSDFIRTETSKNIKVANISIEEPINSLKRTTKSLQNWYIKHFNSIVNNDTVQLKSKDVKDFVKIIKEYSNELDDIQKMLSVEAKSTKDPAILKYTKSKSTNFTTRYLDILKDDDDTLRKTRAFLFNEPYFSTVTIDKDGKRIVDRTSLDDLFTNDKDWYSHKLNLPIIDVETTTEQGLNVDGYENVYKQLLQYTIRTNDNTAENILIYHPELTNNYKYANPDLLDADFVNGNYLNVGGRTLESNDIYTKFEVDGVIYTLYKDKKTAAEYIVANLIANNLLKKSVLKFAGHNAANFDAEMIMKFINEQLPNTINSTKVVDTMWLTRAVMASKGVFKDDPSAKLGNIFKHWFPDETAIIEGAHNANVDTYMNYKILDYIKKELGDNPSEFFRRTFSMDGKAFLDDNSKLFEYINSNYIVGDTAVLENIKHITLDDMLKAEAVSKQKELRTDVNDDYISQIYSKMISDANDLEDTFNNINSIEDLEKFIDNYDEFVSNYYKYLDYNIDDISSTYLYDAYDKLVKKYQDRMTAIYGDSRVVPRLNREYTLDFVLDNFTDLLTDNTAVNSLQEIMTMLDANSMEDLHNAKPNSVVGDILYKLLDYYNYDKEALFKDFSEIKNFYGYTNRINANVKFRQALYEKTDKYADKPNYDDIRKSFQTIMTGLTGYGQDDRASIDNRLTSIIKRSTDEQLKNVSGLQDALRKEVTLHISSAINEDILKPFSEEDRNSIVDIIKKYIDDCIDNIEDYNISIDSRTRRAGAFTILRPAPDRHYTNLMITAFGTQHDGLLGKYQSIINNIKAKDIIESGKAQDFDKNGFDYVIHRFRDKLKDILTIDKQLNKTALPKAYIEDTNGKSIWELNGMGYMYTFKSANNYDRQWNEINKSKNAIYKAFGIKYDPNTVGASTYRNVESKFHTLIKNIQQDWGLSTHDMEQAADISALEDPIYDVEKQIFVDYFDNYIGDDNEFYKEFKSSIMGYKSKDLDTIEDLDKRMTEVKKLEDSSKAFIVAALLQGNTSDSPFLTYKNMGSMSRQQQLLQYVNRYIEESTKTMNEIFMDANGNINYALMYKYLQSNPTMQIAALVPSDRFNNTDKLTKQYQMSGEFITLNAKDAYDLEGMLTHKPDDGVRYFLIDKHNLMQLKKSIGQTTSNKTYTNRQLFNNHPHFQKLMALRDTIAKYMLMPVKVLGLQNLGFTVTNAAEAFLKIMTATTGNRFETLKKYHKAISWHRRWSQATGEIAKAIQGSPFYLGKNQWDAMLSELDNSNAIFKNTDIATIKELLNSNDIKKIRTLLPTTVEFNNAIGSSENIPKYAKTELAKKYTKMFTKSDDEQLDAIKRLAERYVRVNETYSNITKTFNKDEFDFVAEFVNSPAAAAEMQSIKKANELNLIGNKSRMKNGKLDKIDSPVDRFYKKVLFSDWGLEGNNPFKVITPYFNLSLNSDIETINRLALHMDLLDKGVMKSESYNRVLQTFFNYGDKSEPELLAELFFPFISFPFRTTLFWDEMLEENPQLIKLFADLVLTNWGKDAQNQYNQTGITKGGIKITPNLSIESGASFLDSLSFAGNSLNVLGNRKLNPLLGPLYEGAKQLVTGESNWDYRLSRLPLLGKVMYGQKLVDNLSKGQPHLYDIAPSVFNKVYEQNRYYYNNQGRYNYRSIYSKLYTASGRSRWNTKSLKSRTTTIRNMK